MNEIMCHPAKKEKKNEIMSMIGEDIESQHCIKNVKELCIFITNLVIENFSFIRHRKHYPLNKACYFGHYKKDSLITIPCFYTNIILSAQQKHEGDIKKKHARAWTKQRQKCLHIMEQLRYNSSENMSVTWWHNC